jgi:DNA-binding MarR family transcriptional regulator
LADKPALTVKDRAVIHLLDFQRYQEGYEVPLGMTQEGTAVAIGVDRSHAAQELAALVMEGMVEQDKRRIKDRPRKRKVYFLTARGRERALKTKDVAGAFMIKLKADDGSIEECHLFDAPAKMAGDSGTFLMAYNSIDDEGCIALHEEMEEEETATAPEVDGPDVSPPAKVPEKTADNAEAEELVPKEDAPHSAIMPITPDVKNGAFKLAVGTLLANLSFTLGILAILYFRYKLCYSPLVMFPLMLLVGLTLVASGVNALKWDGTMPGAYGYAVRWSMVALASGISLQLLMGVGLLMDQYMDLSMLYSLFLINASILAVLTFFKQLDHHLRAELGIALGGFMVLLGFSVSAGAVFDLPAITGPYWLIFGCTQMLVGREVFLFAERKLNMDAALQLSAVGLGGALFIAIAGITVASGAGLSSTHGIAAAGWLVFSLLVFAARGAFPNDAKGFARLCGHLLQAGIGGLLLAVGFLLILLGRLAEGTIELFLCGPILYHTAGSLFKKGEWREIFISLTIIFLETFTLLSIGL